MRKPIIILLSSALFLNSCGPASDSRSDLVQDSSVVDSTAISLLQDPDTTDTIPAAAYGIIPMGLIQKIRFVIHSKPYLKMISPGTLFLISAESSSSLNTILTEILLMKYLPV